MQERQGYSNPQEVIRHHVETALDWEWREIATTLYQWAERFNTCFFVQRMPAALLSFERMDHRILAAYTLQRNTQGLLYEIAFNIKHLERPLWETLETLLHEYVHLWQQNDGQSPVTRNYHNQEFVARCEQLGLHPQIGSGVHLRPADGPFAELLTAHGLERPIQADGVILNGRGKAVNWWSDTGRKERGRSTLRKWSCGCQNIRVGTKEFYACCTRCGHAFVQVDPQPQEEQPKAEEGRQGQNPSGYWAQGLLEEPGQCNGRGLAIP